MTCVPAGPMIPPVTPVMTPVGAGAPVGWRGGVGSRVPVTWAPAIGSFVMLLITTPSMEPSLVCRRRKTEAAIAVIAMGDLSKDIDTAPRFLADASGFFGSESAGWRQCVREMERASPASGELAFLYHFSRPAIRVMSG